jgi:soluble lytic murein transglycosylase-like protein
MQVFTECLPFRARSACVGLLACLTLAMPAAADAEDAGAITAALPSPDLQIDAASGLPRPLDAADADRYAAIFRLQRDGNWRAADAIIGRLTDQRLLGHALAQRYLHPKYRSAYPELQAWLARYDDHPQAQRIYRLAMVRKPADAAAPEMPDTVVNRVGNPDRGGEPASLNWLSGLAAWRIKAMGEAARQFEIVARDEDGSDWARAAGAFWAARSHLRNRQPETASRWLKTAAEYPRTFYGQLARRALGLEGGLTWTSAAGSDTPLKPVTRTRGGTRALALLQLGLVDLAEDEFYLLLRRGEDPSLTPAVLKIAQRAGLPSVSMRIALAFERKSGNPGSGPGRALLDAALYPIPAWKPEGGFTVDPALLFALMRQESAFNPRAESPAGAAGLMQLMPATAMALAEADLALDLAGADKKALFDPVFNLTLAQRYVACLLKDPSVRGDLLMLAIAYNAGPGNLAKYRTQAGHDADPLLFIESIPGRETRQFVERVLTNYWIYQQRLAQATPSLDALAAGDWPGYTGAGKIQQAAAPNGTN